MVKEVRLKLSPPLLHVAGGDCSLLNAVSSKKNTLSGGEGIPFIKNKD